MIQTGIIYPKLKLTDVGRSVSITCSSKSLVIWSKNGRELPQVINRYSIANVYRMSKVTEADTGLYACTGTHKNGDTFVANSELFVGGKVFHVNVEKNLISVILINE